MKKRETAPEREIRLDKDAYMEPVPYIFHEDAMVRGERREKRLWIALIVAIIMIFASNAIWLYEWCQYDYVSEETSTVYQQDGEGVNIIGDGNEASLGSE